MTASLETGQLGYDNEFGLPRYDLPESEVISLSKEFLASAEPLTPSEGFVCYAIQGESKYANIGRSIELKVFDDAFGNDQEVMTKEYGPYENASTFFVVFDTESQKPAGVLRAIKNSTNGLKTLNDIEQPPLNLSKDAVRQHYGIDSLDDAWDVGTLAVLPQYRGKGTKSHWASIMLYRALYVSAYQSGVEHLVTVMDKRAYKGLQIMGIPFEPIMESPEFSYIDSEVSRALHGYVKDFFPKMNDHLEKLKDEHYFKSWFLRKAMGRLMLGDKIDKSIKLNYK